MAALVPKSTECYRDVNLILCHLSKSLQINSKHCSLCCKHLDLELAKNCKIVKMIINVIELD